MLSTEIDITRWVLASGSLIVLLFLFAFAVRYISHKQPQTAFGMKRKRLRLIETLHLDARNKICLVEMDDMEIILSVGSNSSHTIGTQEKSESTEDNNNQACEPSHMEGIGFLKSFIKKKCSEVNDKQDLQHSDKKKDKK